MTFLLILAVPVVIGMLFLLPLKYPLFEAAPPVRRYVRHEVIPRDTTYAFFLTLLLPFYGLFWMIDIHRDIRLYSQSPALLTPRAAGWVCLVPFAYLMALAAMNDTIGELLQQRGQERRYGTGLIVTASMLFLPLGVALMQSQMNRLIAENGEPSQ